MSGFGRNHTQGQVFSFREMQTMVRCHVYFTSCKTCWKSAVSAHIEVPKFNCRATLYGIECWYKPLKVISVYIIQYLKITAKLRDLAMYGGRYMLVQNHESDLLGESVDHRANIFQFIGNLVFNLFSRKVAWNQVH